MLENSEQQFCEEIALLSLDLVLLAGWKIHNVKYVGLFRIVSIKDIICSILLATKIDNPNDQ